MRAQLAGWPEKRDRVAARRRDLRPLQARYRELSLYYTVLKRLEEEAEEDPIRQRRRGLQICGEQRASEDVP